MPKPPKAKKARALPDVVEHVLSAIEQIESFTAGMTFTDFQGDQRTMRAVERCLEIISEASRDIPAELKLKHPSVDWRGMANAGNMYRHGYEHVSTVMVWKTVVDDLPLLKALVAAMQGGKPV